MVKIIYRNIYKDDDKLPLKMPTLAQSFLNYDAFHEPSSENQNSKKFGLLRKERNTRNIEMRKKIIRWILFNIFHVKIMVYLYRMEFCRLIAM